jgi:hypothetical protein
MIEGMSETFIWYMLDRKSTSGATYHMVVVLAGLTSLQQALSRSHVIIMMLACGLEDMWSGNQYLLVLVVSAVT